MELRIKQEEQEKLLLGEFAQLNAYSKGRVTAEEKCSVRTEFQRDRDRIIHSKAFRRMKHKTQVFISPEGDHYRTRLTHTLEVAQIARTIARALSLNEDLTEAIALGHDLGHTPFGHAGERALDKLCSFGFAHNEQSVRVVERLEKEGKGLNLTWEVIDGIRNHRTSGSPSTMEGKVVQLSDKIAYVNHDMDDAFRAGILRHEDIPSDIVEIIGDRSSRRINAMIINTIENSVGKTGIFMSGKMSNAVKRLRKFMFEKVYATEGAEKEHEKAERIVEILFDYYMESPESLSHEFRMLLEQGDKQEQVVCDYIACMTDRFAVAKFQEMFVPANWSIY